MATILVVEDEPTVLLLSQSILEDAGHQILTAASLPEAVGIIESDTAIDLVFTDINLGSEEDGGFIVGNLIATKRPQTPVLYTSGRPLTDGLKALLNDRSDFLPKPHTGEEILTAINKLLGERPS